MTPRPLRLLFVGYGLAACAGAAAFAVTGAGLVGLLLFWLGGAVMTLVLAATPGLSRPFRARAPEPETLAAELARWEADRLSSDAASPEAERRTTG